MRKTAAAARAIAFVVASILALAAAALTRAMHAIQAARGSTTFLLDPSKSPSQLGVSFENEVSWAGAKR